MTWAERELLAMQRMDAFRRAFETYIAALRALHAALDVSERGYDVRFARQAVRRAHYVYLLAHRDMHEPTRAGLT